MGVYFGTDGIRGKFNEELTVQIAYSCGNALGSEIENSKIIIGSDTRLSGQILTLAFGCGAMNSGADVTNVGVCPTPCISYLTKKLNFDFGVIISASHNSAEFNGIKIFDCNGKKISEEKERELEKKFIKQIKSSFDSIGKFFYKPYLVKLYLEYLDNLFSIDLTNKLIAIDCSNGASSFIAKNIFERKGAKVICIANNPNGININKNCGCLNTDNLKQTVLNNHADFGFAFDGDADRLIAVDELGNILNGDMLIYIFAIYFKTNKKLNPPIVVGTRHTNMGIEKKLNENGIDLIRVDIGDKYVSSKLIEYGLKIGGEQSGHVIIRDYLPTGDGLISALMLSKIICDDNKKLSNYINFNLYSQANINVFVNNKTHVINSEKLIKIVKVIEEKLGKNGRVMIRESGTEPCIRVMVETEDENVSQRYANEIALTIKQIEKEYNICVE